MPRVQGSKGFTNSEIRLVLKEILAVLPRSADDWKKVYENCKNEVTNFNFQHPDRPLSFRKQETLRRKYSDMIALSKKKDSNLIGDKEYIRLCHIASSIHTLCVIRSPEKTNSAITEAEIKKKQQEIMLSLQYDNYYNQSNGFGLGDFGLEDESKLNLFQLSQHRQFIQQFQRPIQPKIEGTKILTGKIMDTGSYSSGSGKSSPLISNTLEQNGIETNNEGIALSQYQDELQNKKRGGEANLSPYQMTKRIKYGNTDDSLSMLMQTAINQNNISNTSIPSDIEFIEGSENNLGVREQLRYIMSVVENIYRKVHNIENQLYKIDVITNHLDILESKIYLLSANKNESKNDDKKKKNVINDTLFNGSTSSKTLSLAKNVFLNKINSNSITPSSVSKLVSSSLDTIGVNNLKNPIQLSPKSRGRVQFFEDTFGLKLNLTGKLDPDFNSPTTKISDDIILLPETMENIRQFRKDYENYLTPKSLERINEFEAQYAKTNPSALNNEIFKTVNALGTSSDVTASTNLANSTNINTDPVSIININENKLNTEIPPDHSTSSTTEATSIEAVSLANKVNEANTDTNKLITNTNNETSISTLEQQDSNEEQNDDENLEKSDKMIADSNKSDVDVSNSMTADASSLAIDVNSKEKEGFEKNISIKIEMENNDNNNENIMMESVATTNTNTLNDSSNETNSAENIIMN